MNDFRTARQLSRLLALLLCGLFYGGLVFLNHVWSQRELRVPETSAVQAVTLSFSQIELLAAVEEPPPAPEPEPMVEEVPAPEPEPLLEPGVVLEEMPEEPPPEPEPEPVQAEAQVTQEAAAPQIAAVPQDELLAWVRELLEKEKYYPPSARRAGYEGLFRIRVLIDVDGRISEATVLSGSGHILLKRALGKMLAALPGRKFGQPLPQPEELLFEFGFELN